MQRLASRSREIVFLALLLVSSGTLHGQRPAVAADTVWMESFWVIDDFVVKGRDTTDVYPLFVYDLERAIWSEGTPRPLTVYAYDLARPLSEGEQPDGPVRPGAYEMDPAEGFRHPIEGPPLVALPEGGRFAAGFAWTDSIIRADTSTRGTTTQVHRRFEVARILDTLETRAAVVEATFRTQEYRPHDPDFLVTETLLSMQTAGTGSARYVFDVATGRLLARSARARASGFAATTHGDGMQSIPAGRRLTSFRRPIDPGRAALLRRARSFGSSETTTFRWAPEVYHRTELRGDTAESLHISTTSGVTVGRTEFREGRVVRHVVERTGPDGSRAASFAVQGEEAAGDVRLRPPSGVVGWGVAEAGMEEHLWPVLAGLPPAKQPQRFAIYRPLERSWERVLVRSVVSNQDKMFVVTRPDGQPLQVLCYAMESGALLFSVRPAGEHWESRMVPREEGRIRAILAWSRFVPGVFPQVRSFPGPL